MIEDSRAGIAGWANCTAQLNRNYTVGTNKDRKTLQEENGSQFQHKTDKREETQEKNTSNLYSVTHEEDSPQKNMLVKRQKFRNGNDSSPIESKFGKHISPVFTNEDDSVTFRS